MRILNGTPDAPRPWIIQAGTHQLRLRLSPTSRPVRAGTPLRPSGAGWEACPADAIPWAFSADYKQPGDEVMAWREVTIDTGHVYGPPGTRLKIVDVDDRGAMTLAPDPNGLCVVTFDSYVLFTTLSPVLQEVTARLDALENPTEIPLELPGDEFLNRPKV